jgi:hypothetical protein
MKLAQKIAINYLRARLNMLAVISHQGLQTRRSSLSLRHNTGPKDLPRISLIRVRGFIFYRMVKRSKAGNGMKLREKNYWYYMDMNHQYANFDHHISRGIKNGYAVYAFDAPAHGNSEGKKINLLDYIEMIRNVEKIYARWIIYLPFFWRNCT